MWRSSTTVTQKETEEPRVPGPTLPSHDFTASLSVDNGLGNVFFGKRKPH